MVTTVNAQSTELPNLSRVHASTNPENGNVIIQLREYNDKGWLAAMYLEGRRIVPTQAELDNMPISVRFNGFAARTPIPNEMFSVVTTGAHITEIVDEEPRTPTNVENGNRQQVNLLFLLRLWTIRF